VTAPTAIDGRSLRSERTRAALALAYLDLVTEGDVRPTAERIAEKAGVSPRSVFKHFPDREDLFAEASKLQEARARAIVQVPADPSAPLDERLDLFVDQRAEFAEFVSPVRRAAALIEPFSEVVQERLCFVRGLAGAQVAHFFGPEIEARRDDNLLPGLVAIAAWPTWDQLRTHQGLPYDRAKAVMRAMLASQLKDG
jgi:AcrR family transcriptional regulator